MFSNNNKITIRQLQALLVLDVFGTGVIILPRRAATYAGQDGYLVIIAATALAMVYAFLIMSAGRKFPGESFSGYVGKILSKPASAVLSAALAVKIIANTALELRLFGEMMKSILLMHTPYGVVSATMLSVCAYAAIKGYETRARIAEILFVIVFVPLIFIFCVGMKNIDFTNLQPYLTTAPQDIIAGAFGMGPAFTGLEFCLLVHPYLEQPKDARKGVLHAVLIIGTLMLFITVITIARFGIYDLQHQMWPVLEMMDRIELPGGFIERQDALMMSFWILSVFAVLNAGLFFSSLALKDMVKKGRRSIYVLLCGAAVFALSFLPRNIEQVYGLLDTIFLTFGIVFYLVVPLLLLAVAKLKGIGDRYE